MKYEWLTSDCNIFSELGWLIVSMTTIQLVVTGPRGTSCSCCWGNQQTWTVLPHASERLHRLVGTSLKQVSAQNQGSRILGVSRREACRVSRVVEIGEKWKTWRTWMWLKSAGGIACLWGRGEEGMREEAVRNEEEREGRRKSKGANRKRVWEKGRRQERRGGKDGFAVNCTTDDQVLKGK